MKFAFWRSKPPAIVAPESYPQSRQREKRSLTQHVTSLSSMFKAADKSILDRWSNTPLSPDQLISRYQMTLVARSREQWSNNDYVHAFIRLVRQNIVGPLGIQMQAKVVNARGKLDATANSAIEAWWQDWSKRGNCEVTGQLTFRAVQALAVETAARDGEVFARFIYGEEAGKYGIAIQLIDPQRLPTWYENYQSNSNGTFIRQGIEFNRYGKPIAYHFSSTEESNAFYYTYSGVGFLRIPAEDIVHAFVPEMVSQRRGLPWASTSLFRLHHLQGFEDASVQNARAGAAKMGFIQYRDGEGPTWDDDADVASTIQAEPLSFHELPQGAEIKPFEPNYPSGEFQTFHKAMLRGAAAGMGVLYNNVAGDLEGVNFSSIRQGTLDEREHWKELQQWLIESFIDPIRLTCLKYALLRGDIKVAGKPISASKLDAYSAAEWQGRRWQWIDPRSDVDGAIASVRGGVRSFSSVIREEGKDPETVFAELASDIEAMKAAGIDEVYIHQFMFGEAPKPQPAGSSNDSSTTKADQ